MLVLNEVLAREGQILLHSGRKLMDISITRRRAMLAPLIGGFAALTLNGYAFAYAPIMRLDVTRYDVAPEHWRSGPALRIAVLTDLHFGEPFVSLERLEEIVAATNALHPDVICLLGDFEPGSHFCLTRSTALRLGTLPCHVESPSRRTHGAWQSRLVVGCGGAEPTDFGSACGPRAHGRRAARPRE